MADTDINGHGDGPKAGEPGRFRVRFGTRPTQNIPREWAETILMELARSKPQLFGKLLQDAALGGDQ